MANDPRESEMRAWAYNLARNKLLASRVLARCVEAAAKRDRADPHAAARASAHLLCGVAVPEDFLSDPYGKGVGAVSGQPARLANPALAA